MDPYLCFEHLGLWSRRVLLWSAASSVTTTMVNLSTRSLVRVHTIWRLSRSREVSHTCSTEKSLKLVCKPLIAWLIFRRRPTIIEVSMRSPAMMLRISLVRLLMRFAMINSLLRSLTISSTAWRLALSANFSPTKSSMCSRMILRSWEMMMRLVAPKSVRWTQCPANSSIKQVTQNTEPLLALSSTRKSLILSRWASLKNLASKSAPKLWASHSNLKCSSWTSLTARLSLHSSPFKHR